MQEPDTGGRVAAAISNAMVGLIADTTGRGPTKARTTIGRDHVLVMLRDTLTKGERRLAEGGFPEDVLHVRHRFQEVMRPRAIPMIEELVGRRVVAFMSDNHLDPDMAAEVFVLEPPVDGDATQLEEAETSG
ncbi:MAG: Na-translocating system protein MpsC family protein [Thermoleophilaceae bacterium]